eukprot:TRINITY_DN56960_c0_g1_i1.p1 TRINITY_DN56960_c0_g1~~TRINITY_DN56960_c0_g1_i1.p1  ORF type:complete len:130 (+),score=15.73 TRINITY_DN56960_c0_g1_i1:89-478(+)
MLSHTRMLAAVEWDDSASQRQYGGRFRRGESSTSSKKIVGNDGQDQMFERLPQVHEGSILTRVDPIGCLTLDDLVLRLHRVERARLMKQMRRMERVEQMRQTLARIEEDINESSHDDSPLRKLPRKISL